MVKTATNTKTVRNKNDNFLKCDKKRDHSVYN